MSTRRNGNRARCQHEGCEKFAQTRGLCKAHGGGSRCRDPTCNKLAQSRGLCIAHGGGRRCQSEGCTKLAQSKGFCISHGGGRRCTVPHCEKFSQVKGRCKSHSKLAESEREASVDADDGEETDPDSAKASPHRRAARFSPLPARLSPRSTLMMASERLRVQSPPLSLHDVDPATAKLRIDYLVNPLSRQQSHEFAQAQSRGYGFRMPPPPRPVLLTIGSRDNILGEDDHDDALLRRASVERSVDPLKRIPSIAPRNQEEEELRPLPYAYPGSIMDDEAEEKQQRSHTNNLLPSRFLLARAPMRTSAAHFSSHAAPRSLKPTSIPLLSFLDHSKEEELGESTHVTWMGTTTAMSCSTQVEATVTTIATSATSTRASASTRSVVLPSLSRVNMNMR